MKKFEDMDQKAASIMEQGKISDADLDQVNGGLFEDRENRFSLNNLLFRRKQHDDLDVQLLPMRPDQDDRDGQQNSPNVIKL